MSVSDEESLVRTRCLALVLLALPLTASAADDALLEFYLGPRHADGVAFKQVEVRLDGKVLPLPTPMAAEERPLLESPIPSGPHSVDVEIRLEGESGFFSYLDDYRFKLGGHLDVKAPSGEVTAVKASVVRKSGFLVPWESRYRLELSATSYASDRAGGSGQATAANPEPVAAAPAANPEPVTAPAVTPVPVAALPAATPAPVPGPRRPATAAAAGAKAACALKPVPFPFNRATLDGASKKALDRFAACLARSSGAVRLEGHCDKLGAEGYNLRLGERRADAVLEYLRGKGLTSVLLSSRSFGWSTPRCTEETAACRARNRRVEAVLVDE